ncbi:pyridoxal-phosphate-dependent aminotransferase family protein [Helicobacter cappadocius]|uniref:Alanine--glyoxylate aminotransferase family protein n=1 Tax=Helicobacter cappadocius TaxID=3063998 RepID=A0AA90T4H2_9HELI|nr:MULTISPECIES: alanine--glyoxylate aminotransferase family protein [unclassified Helicobacter]MDO7252431.1 alanine--glyoxylate aminotransferase family protein [Helicobacter sp. faydin-H75]MDP2538298.1 alanine--glyoxylate aminotransferase family protein [Helicobacter sp. faydin-H76]
MLLFTPGPTPIPEDIRIQMAKPTIHHRTPEFEEYFASARRSLRDLLKMPEVLMLSSSGTGAMEACVRTFCVSKLLSVNSGKFGERFGKIAKAYNIPNIEIKHDWDTPVEVEEILEIIKSDSGIDAIAIQICESAGGLRHPVEKIAQAIKAYNPEIIVIADAITAMGVEDIDTRHIDALIGGSQKAFMLPPGMSIIGLSTKAVDLINARDIGFYFNLKTELKNQIANTTAWTAPTTIIIGLVKYFEIVQALGGISEIYRQTTKRAIATQKALQSIGLKIYPKNPALSMTTIIDEANASSIRKILKSDFDVNIAGGQDHLKTSIFRINHMGVIPVNEALWVVNAIELILDRLGVRKFDGSANIRFLESYYS